MERRRTVGPGSQKAPFRERLPGTTSKLGKGTAWQRGQTLGAEGRCVGGGIVVGSGSGNDMRVCGRAIGKGDGPDQGCGGRGSGSWKWSGRGS